MEKPRLREKESQRKVGGREREDMEGIEDARSSHLKGSLVFPSNRIPLDDSMTCLGRAVG